MKWESEILVIALVSACLAGWCATAGLPPIPHKRAKRVVPQTQGAGAKALLVPLPPPISPGTNVIVWQYPKSINPTDLWWNLEASADLKVWAVVVSNASGAATVNVNKSDPLRIYRLSGRLQP